MKINLSKEEIKKGCDLIDWDYASIEGYDTLGLKNPSGIFSYVKDDKEFDLVYYPCFLQLVIEAINKKYRSLGVYTYGIDQTRDSISVGYDSKTDYTILETFYYYDMSEEEAKEKAIAHVFKNMED